MSGGRVRGLVTAAGISLVLLATSAVWASVEKDFVPLFDGRTLDGWRVHGGSAQFAVEDGMIVGTGRPGTHGNTFLCTDKTYENFILKAEFRCMDVNSGIQFRSTAHPDKSLECGDLVFGYQSEITIGGRNAGRIYDEGRRDLKGLVWLDKTPEDRLEAAKKSYAVRGWNEMTIDCRGDHIRTWINGNLVTDMQDDWELKGFFGLQVHTQPKTERPGHVYWRNIRIRELPPGREDAAARRFAVGPHGRYATIEAAVQAARAVKGRREIVLENGVHRLAAGIELDRRDSGVTIRAAEPGHAVVLGSVPVSGWRKVPGTPYLEADCPASKEGTVFRSLVVDGRLAPRSEYPGGGKVLMNTNVWKVRWLSSVGNGWERKPTHDELTRMCVRKGDLPGDMDLSSADILVYHDWDNSLVSGATYDPTGLVVRLSQECLKPPGAFGRNGYVIYNVKAGMKEPGQWYHDRVRGKIVYWPRGDEAGRMPIVEVPKTDRLLNAQGVDRLRIEGVEFANTVPPAKRASFGGNGVGAAVTVEGGEDDVVVNSVFRNSGGIGLIVRGTRYRILDSLFEQNGSCSAFISGRHGLVRGCGFREAGQVFSSACSVYYGGRHSVFTANEIDGAPYCGVCYDGAYLDFVSNTVSRVMQRMNDGAAFYGMSEHCTIRGNRVFDNRPTVSARHAFYYDEGSYDGLVTGNVVEGGFKEVVHNHISRGIVVSNNVFGTPGDHAVSFAGSRDGVFVDNEVRVGGKVVSLPDATSLAAWQGNRYYVRGVLTNVMPTVLHLPPADKPLPVPRTVRAPAFDGSFDQMCWPGTWARVRCGREATDEGGAPHFLRACHDGTNLYFAVRVARFEHEQVRTNGLEGADWCVIELPGLKMTCRADGTSESVPQAFGGLEREKRRGFGRNMFFAFGVPFEMCGFSNGLPKEIPFNCTIYDAQYGETRYWDAPIRGRCPGMLEIIK